jgi:predicted RNase H-like HicB family nuclease
MIKNMDYYLNINYDIVISKLTKEDGGGYFAYYKNIPSIMGDGETEKSAIRDVKNAFSCFLEVAIKNKDIIPEPQNLFKVKKINISMTASRVNDLDIYAKRLNTNRSAIISKLTDKLIGGEIRV